MLLRVLLLALLSFLIVRALRVVMRGVVVGVTGGPQKPSITSVKLVRDPICGTHVAPNAAMSLSSKGTTYYFCSEKCREQFRSRG